MRRLACATTLGLMAGLLWALARGLPFFFAIQFPQALRTTSDILNAPALWFVRLWSEGAGLPPRSEFGRDLVLASAVIIVQWVAVGLLAGLWWRARAHTKR